MTGVIHPLDPRTIDFRLDEPHRIYGDTYADTFALVDEEDYLHFGRWMWTTKTSRTGRHRLKVYLRRAKAIHAGSRTRVATVSVYLHIEIMLRSRVQPPSPRHTIVDHINGDSLDCRRENLRWATPRENARNRMGVAYRQQVMAL